MSKTDSHGLFIYEDLLVIINDEHRIKGGIEGKLRLKVRREGFTGTPVNTIFHEPAFVNEQLEKGNYFFADIKKEGIVLYDTGICQLAESKELSPEENRKRAQEYFDYWYKSANEFVGQFDHAIKNEWFNNAAFMLHQATERYLVTIVLVFTGYKPKTHDLNLLYRDACRFDEQFKEVFPRITNEDNRLFNFLQKAYIDARYKLDFKADPSDLECLAERVRLLAKTTSEVCQKKISEIN